MSSILSRLWFGGLVLSLHSATLCYAQAPLARSAGDKYALADLVGLALQHTRLLGAQDARIDENRLAASQARIWPGSSLDLAVGRRSEAAVSGPRYELSWVQPLPLLGKLGLRDIYFLSCFVAGFREIIPPSDNTGLNAMAVCCTL